MTMWSFSIADGWKEIADFLRTSDTDDCAEEKKLAGFSSHPGLSVGDTEGGSFCIEVHTRGYDSTKCKEPQYQFLVGIDVGGGIYEVAVPKLPDLLELLRQTVPLSVSIDEWAMKKDAFTAKIEKEIQSGAFRR